MPITPALASQTGSRTGSIPSIRVSLAPSLGSTSGRNPPPPAVKIGDLCRILEGEIQTGRCLGFLDDQFWEHHVHTATQSCLKGEIRKFESLEDRLSRENLPLKQKYYLNPPPAIESLMLDRCILAVALASAVAHLHNTPWLSESWGVKDIYLINGGKGVSPFGKPYVSKSFATTSPQQSVSCARSAQLRPYRVMGNEMVFALGVALLELSYGKPILSLQTADDLDPHGKETRLTKELIARRLLGEIRDRESQNYADAVTRCISGNFGTLDLSLDNKEFREYFYRGVVLPLQGDYKHFTQPGK